MFRYIPTVALLGAFWLGLCIGAAIAEPVRPIVIGDDDGGGIDDHLKFYNRIGKSGVPVILDGICVSACTFVLTLPYEQVCVTPRASLGFHLASTGTGKALPDLTEALIRRYYPKAVQEWIAAWVQMNGPLTLQRISYMPADYLVEHHVFPACPTS